MTRPAETAGAAGTVGILVGRIAGIKDPTTIAYIGAGIGLLPAIVTFLVASGGLRGAFRTFWRGKQQQQPADPATVPKA